MTQIVDVVGMQHRSVCRRVAAAGVRLEECFVAAGQQVELGIVQSRVAIGVRGAVLVAQETQPVETKKT